MKARLATVWTWLQLIFAGACVLFALGTFLWAMQLLFGGSGWYHQ